MDDCEELYNEVLKQEGIDSFVHDYTSVEFLEACRSILRKNPQNSFSNNVQLARIYLQFILKIPDEKV